MYLKRATGVYLTCATYGAFAVREFLGPDMFRTLLTANPTRWPWHAWINLPLIPFSLIAVRTPLVLWTTSPLVPLLFPWPTSTPVAPHVARSSSGGLRIAPLTRLPLWPPPPALVCALFPLIRALYQRLRTRVMRALVQDLFPPRPQTAQQQEERLQRLRQLARQEQLRRREQQEQQQQRPQPQEQPGQEQPQQRRFRFQVGDQFALHLWFDRHALPADAPRPPLAALPDVAVDNRADQQPQQPAQEQRPPADPAPQQQNPEPARQQPEEQPEQQQHQQQQPQAEQEQEQGQGQGQAPQPWDDNNPGAVAARAIRVTGASLGRLIGGALAMPIIARIMGAVLLRLSRVVPLVRAIIAPRPPVAPGHAGIGGLVGIWGAVRRPALHLFGAADVADVAGVAGGFGARVLSGFLATSPEWATSDPVWYDVYFYFFCCTLPG